MVVFKVAFFDSIQAKFLCISGANVSSWLFSEDTNSFTFFVYTHFLISPSLKFPQYFAAEKKTLAVSVIFFRVRQRSPKKIIVFYGPPSHQPEDFLMLFWNKQFSSRTFSTIAVKIFIAPPDPDICFSINLNGSALPANGTVVFCNSFSDTWESSVVSNFLTEVKRPWYN